MKTRGAYALVVLAAVMWGTWRSILLAAEAQVPTKTIDAHTESAVVMIVITVVAFIFLAFEKRDRKDPSDLRAWPDWLAIAWLGIADALNVLLLFAAYAHTTVAIAVTTHYLAPIFVAAVAPVFLRERPHALTWIAILAGVFGLTLLLRPWSHDLASRDWIGAAAGAGSAVFYASNVIVNKRLVTKFSPVELMAFHGVIATPFLLVLVPHGGFASLNVPAVLILIVGGIGPGALGGIFFVWALRHITTAPASTLTLLEPLVAVTLAVLFYGEHVAPISWLGASVILVSAGAVMRLRA